MTRRHVPFTCPKEVEQEGRTVLCGRPLVRVTETREWQGSIRRKRRCEAGHVVVTRETVAA